MSLRKALGNFMKGLDFSAANPADGHTTDEGSVAEQASESGGIVREESDSNVENNGEENDGEEDEDVESGSSENIDHEDGAPAAVAGRIPILVRGQVHPHRATKHSTTVEPVRTAEYESSSGTVRPTFTILDLKAK